MTPTMDPWQPPDLTGNPTVYHYADAGGLVGIMNSCTLWASEATSLNDLSEVDAGYDYIYERLGDLDAKHQGNAQKALRKLRYFADSRSDGGRVRKEVFVLCASLDDDDAAQWRLYTGDRAGYSLHIDTGLPLRIVAPRGTPGKSGMFSGSSSRSSHVQAWHPVVYTDADKDDLVDTLAAWAIARYEGAIASGLQPQTRLRESRPDSPAEQEALDTINEGAFQLEAEYADALMLAAALMKPEGFKGEREVRLIATASMPEYLVQYRASADLPVRYLRLACSRADVHEAFAIDYLTDERTGKPARRLPVTGVTIGPTPYFDHVKDTVVALCRSAGINNPVVKPSVLPLRW